MTNPWADFTFVGVGQKQPSGTISLGAENVSRGHALIQNLRNGSAHGAPALTAGVARPLRLMTA